MAFSDCEFDNGDNQTDLVYRYRFSAVSSSNGWFDMGFADDTEIENNPN
ncbi:MAG: hypothetical protein UX78_C0029G0006 [Candidatus Amesbacteria bacterium GW2011_GWA2_47_11]|uniref:Uncharacterized protein n=1 Tax=Candidatus Amesbacteria bacterium GW2011_GWA2_47_11 TaxID=1618357 RepID=A0A0G1RCE6_9BACT|nr:MAG: hypothetical protein UX78_C0029G0006 [Candidatus Amesbacteria bacterium GW2011_GWA2_47_11]